MRAKRPAATIVIGLLAALLPAVAFPPHITTASASSVGASWTQLTPGAPPYSLAGGFAYDAALDQAIYFGGENMDSLVTSNDMWSFDGSIWRQLPTQYPWPSARQFPQMTYDSDRNRIVLFGGYDGSRLLNDTWEWDGSTWSQVSSSGPSPRNAGTMVYDSVRKQTILFGGATSSGLASDTWLWNGTTWSLLSPSSAPVPRELAGMAFDTARARAVLFGGLSSGGRLGDTWEWDGTNWLHLAPPASPTPRWGMAIGYDALNGRTMLFGGDSFPNDNQTWEWDGSSWREDFPSIVPLPSIYYQMAYDTQRQRLDVYGGDHEGNPDTYARDTWALTAQIPIATSLSVAAASGSFGGSATLSASATAADGSAISGSVTFAVGSLTVKASIGAAGTATAALPLGRMAPGAYSISATLTPASGYLASSATGVLTISPAPLTVRANDVTRWYNEPNPVFTASFSGFVAGDTPDRFQGLTFTTPASTMSGVGTYPITPGGLVAPEYAVTYAGGSLTVRQDQVALVQGSADTTLAGDPVQLVVHVVGPPNTLPLSEGSVTFADQDGTVLCAQLPVVNGTAQCSIRPRSVGTHNFTVIYRGTANVADQTSLWTQTVVPRDQ